MKSINIRIRNCGKGEEPIIIVNENYPGMYLHLYKILGVRLAFLLHEIGIKNYKISKSATSVIYNHIYNNLDKIIEDK